MASVYISPTFTPKLHTVSGPKEFVEAAYKDIPGAVPTNDTLGAGLGYIIPCDTKLNLTFYFACVMS